MLPINRNPSARDLRSFARIWFPLFVAFLGGMIWWRCEPADRGDRGLGRSAPSSKSACSPARPWRGQVFVGLMIVTYPIGLVVSTVALALLFYGLFTPLGWAMRLGGRDPLRLRTRADRSEWHPVTQDDDPQQMFRQF